MGLVYADPESDRMTIRNYFKNRFPDIPFNDYINGVYALDKNARAQWQAIEDFPPYEIAVDKGEELFNTPFKNGKSYIDCFPEAENGIRQNYPLFNTETGHVVTLELAINECRKNNSEKELKYGKGEIIFLSSYLAYVSRGKPINITVPDDPRAFAAYEQGKKMYYSRRGQLNMSCANCHIWSAGNQLRAEILSPALGQTSHFPVFRSKWEEMGSLHRRYAGCNRQIRTEPFALQSKEYRNLEYFHTYMNNGLLINGPGSRK